MFSGSQYLRSSVATARAVAAIVFVFALVACAPSRSVDRTFQGLDGQGGGQAGPGSSTGGFQRGGNDAGSAAPGPHPPGTDGAQPDPQGGPAAMSGSDAGPDAAVPDATPSPPDAEWVAPPLSQSLAESCAGLPAWEESKRYEDGDAVVAGEPLHRFECRPWPYSPWCSLIHYRPGLRTTHWPDAWVDAGACPAD